MIFITLLELLLYAVCRYSLIRFGSASKPTVCIKELTPLTIETLSSMFDVSMTAFEDKSAFSARYSRSTDKE
ncbi:hypothetical protein D3C86_2066840 [compost metagenome]